MLLPAPEWPRAVRVLFYVRADHIGPAAALRPSPFRHPKI